MAPTPKSLKRNTVAAGPSEMESPVNEPVIDALPEPAGALSDGRTQGSEE